MSITVTSTTDDQTAVLTAQGDKAAEAQVEDKQQQAAPTQETERQGESTAESATEDTTEDEDHEGQEQDGDKPKRKGGFQKRIDKLNRKLTDQGQELEYWRQQVLRGANQPGATQEQQPTQKDQPATQQAGKPKPEDFEDHDTYVDALTDWKLDQKLKERDGKTREAELRTEQQKQVTTFQERVNQARTQYEDFDEVMEDAEDVPLSAAVQEVLLNSEQGAELMYTLAKDKAELLRICKLSPIQAAKELGKIEAKLTKQAETSEKPAAQAKTTQAPKPIAPVGTKSSGAATKSPDEMSYQEFKAWRESQSKKR